MNNCSSELCLSQISNFSKISFYLLSSLFAGSFFLPYNGYAQGLQVKQSAPVNVAPSAVQQQTLPAPTGNIPAVTASGQVVPTPPSPAEQGAVTKKPLPYFLSLRADEVNMRAGPGTQYPVVWTYHRRGMPVKVTREFDIWRLVEDVDGQKGWVQQAILSGGRSFVITGEPLSVGQEVANTNKDKTKKEHTDSRIVGYIANAQAVQPSKSTVIVHSEPQDSASAVAVLKPGVVGSIKNCPSGSEWCKVALRGYQGWIPRNSFWGILPQEIIEAH